ncbi:MAG: TRAP transporter large permease subunit [Pseudomonadota bacterium]|nr:TRAP transporter large permease subunit [Pseudomonadota bacterium]
MIGPVSLVGLLLVFGAPVFVIIGLTSVVLFLQEGMPVEATAQLLLSKFNSPTLLAVPFFILAATFMQSGGIIKALIGVAEAWVGRLRGGLALVCVVATTLFAAISGSSVATAMAMGHALVPVMKDRGYPEAFSVGTIAAAGTLGVLIPPSLGMILFAYIAEESVLRLFLAGVVPGLLQAALFCGYIIWRAGREGFARTDKISGREFAARQVRGMPALAIPIVIFVGIFGGLVSVAEAAAVSATLAITFSMLIYHNFSVRNMPEHVLGSIASTAAIMLIVASAFMFSHWLTHTGAPADLMQSIVDAGLEGWQFLLILNILMLILGMFLDANSVILIIVPVVSAVLEPLGISKAHFAVIVIVNMEIGALTPPIGLNLFVMSQISGLPLPKVIRGVLPYAGLMLILLALVTYVPEISMWLPDLVLGAQ